MSRNDDLRADDPGGTVEAAFAALSVLTIDMPLTINRIDLRDIYNALGGAKGEVVIQALETAAQSNPVIARALAWAQPGEGMGIDICDTEVQGVFQALVGGSVTQAMIDAIIALSTLTVRKYPGLKPGWIVEARRGDA